MHIEHWLLNPFKGRWVFTPVALLDVVYRVLGRHLCSVHPDRQLDFDCITGTETEITSKNGKLWWLNVDGEQ